jgi:hypothetical protein
VQEFKRGDRRLGHFCRVDPQGYVLVSLRRELVPVRASSETSDLDPRSEEDLADLIKDGLERMLDHIETTLGPIEHVGTEELLSLGFTDYRPVWEALERGDQKINYQAGEELLASEWNQGIPYNDQCPAPPPGDDCTAPKCAVGCVALAGAQIMHYWCWPPYGEDQPYDDPYDWFHMPDRLFSSFPQVEIDAVAELCYEVGLAVGMDWCGSDTGPCASGAFVEDMIDVYKYTYHYSRDCALRERWLYNDEEWFDLMKVDLNINRPILYGVDRHAVVADGWRMTGSPAMRQYHMIYGGNVSNNTWYPFDGLPDGGLLEECMLVGIYPSKSFHDVMNGTYPREPALPYRYFDRDVTGGPATIEAGQGLQFLADISVTCTVDSVIIYGSPPDSLRSRLFIGRNQHQGVLISNGAVKMKPGGGIRFF